MADRDPPVRKDRSLDLAGAILTVLGVVKVVGLLSGVWFFEWIGYASGISPAPAPYDRVYDPDYGNRDFGGLIGCENRDGEIKWMKWEHEMRNRTPGPHRRVVSMLSYFYLIRHLESVDDPRRAILSKFYFCQNGPLAQAAECSADLESVMFKTVSHDPSRKPLTQRYLCTP